MNKKNNYIWIFGENLGETANNNSFYFWKHIVNQKKDSINKYIILAKNKKNKKMYKTLNKKEREAVVWRNSLKHFILYHEADMQFVTLSYRDVRPEKFLWKKYDFKIEKPLVYLQHGTLGMKKIDYKGNGYNNNFFRFIYYNKNIKEKLIEENDFRKYQLHYGEFLPRYKELVKRNNKNKGKEKNQILWFLTWRTYKENSAENKVFLKTINSVLRNERLNIYLKENNLKLKLCVHQLYQGCIDNILEGVNKEHIDFTYATQTDIMDEIVESKLLITDYSSLGFDFTFLKKPVILFQPDRDRYLEGRNVYCSLEELEENSIKTIKELVKKIVEEKYELNKFFADKINMDIDYEYVEKGKHIDKTYKKLKDIQKNKITFLGYNFYGVGGTVSATRSLAEGLLEKGKLVELISLKKAGQANKLPNALNIKYIYDSNEKKVKIMEKLKRIIHSGKRNYGYLKYDESNKYLKPFVGYRLKKILGRIRSNTVVSTRETLHLFVKDAKSNKLENKVCFFHCQAKVVEKVFPGIMSRLKKEKLDKIIFITEKNKDEYEKEFNYNNSHYNDSLIIGNALERMNVRNINKIEPVEEKDRYSAIYLLRISEERKEDLQNLIKFGLYLKEKDVSNMVINVFGDGEYVDDFIELIAKNDLFDIINYRGKTNNAPYHIRRHDVLTDFSLINSFGMPYIEGILNGKMVYCMKNEGSQEVMRDIPEAFINSYDDLVKKINNLPNITKEELQSNYRKIEDRFSRAIIAEKFIKYIEKK